MQIKLEPIQFAKASKFVKADYRPFIPAANVRTVLKFANFSLVTIKLLYSEN